MLKVSTADIGTLIAGVAPRARRARQLGSARRSADGSFVWIVDVARDFPTRSSAPFDGQSLEVESCR
jgi:hypothetical protein